MTAFLTALALITAAPGDGRCYILLFGGEAQKFRPNTAHTWATFVKQTPTGLESFTISWLPQQLPVRPLHFRPEPGRNYGLHETLDLFTTGKQKLALWGPYEIRPEWYADALTHKSAMDRGEVQYLVFDRGPHLPRGPVRHPELSHCVHAITRTSESLRQASNPIASYGELITRKVAARMDDVGLLINSTTTHDWLISALAVERYPITRRHLGEPLLAILR